MAEKFYNRIAQFVIILSISSLLLGFLGIYHQTIIFSLLLILILGFGWLWKRDKKVTEKKEGRDTMIHIGKDRKMSEGLGVIILVSVFAMIFGGLLTNENYYSGRDHGDSTNNAIILDTYHSFDLKDELVEKFYTNKSWHDRPTDFLTGSYTYQGSENGMGIMRSNFYLGYPAYMAPFVSVFGTGGLRFVNVLPLFISLLSLWFILKRFLLRLKLNNSFGRLTFFALAMSSFGFIYFPKVTFAEGLYQALLLYTIYLLLKLLGGYNRGNRSVLVMWILLSSTFAAFVRVEGILTFIMTVLGLIVFFAYRFLKKLNISKLKKRTVFKLGLAFIVLCIAGGSVYLSFRHLQPTYASLGGVSHFVESYFSTSRGVDIPPEYSMEIFGPDTIYTQIPTYVLKVLASYNLLLPIWLAGSGLVVLMISWFRKTIKFKNFIYVMVPIVMIMPISNVLWNILNSFDTPWSLRRYIAGIIPLSILYSAIFIGFLFQKKKKIAIFVLLMVVILNVSVVAPYVLFRENEGLLSETKKLNAAIPNDNELILIQDQLTGGRYNDDLIQGPMMTLYQRDVLHYHENSQARLNDILKTTDHGYENIYVVASRNDLQEIKKRFPYIQNWEEVYSSQFVIPKLRIIVVDVIDTINHPGYFSSAKPFDYDVDLVVIKANISNL